MGAIASWADCLNFRRFRRWLAFWSPIFLLACGGNSCTSCSIQQQTPKTPSALVLPETLKLRVTQHGFDVIAQEIRPLMLNLLGQNANGQAILDVQKLLGPLALNLNGGLGLFKSTASVRDLVLTLDLQGLQLTLVDPSHPARLRLTLDHAQIGVISGIIAGEANFAGIDSNAACMLKNGVNVGKKDPHLATLSTTLDLELGIDAAGNLAVKTQLIAVTLHDLGFGLDKNCGLPECADQVLAEDPCLECGLCTAGNLAGNAAQLLTQVLEPVLGQLLVTLGNAVGVQLVQKALNGKPLDLELPLDVATLEPKLGPLAALLGPPPVLYLRGKPAADGLTVHDQGLDVLLSGALFAEANPCVLDPGQDATTVFAQLPLSPPPGMPLTIQQKTVDLGLMLSQNVVEEGLWSVLRSGLLCANVDARALWTLSDGKLLLSAEVLDLLLPGVKHLSAAKAPLRLGVLPSANPNQAPRVQLETLADGLRLHLALRNFGLSVEVETRGRWLTLLEVRADLQVTARVRVPAGKLALAIEAVTLENLNVLEQSLFAHAQVAEIVPALVNAALPILLQKPLELEVDAASLVTQALGVPLQAELLGLEALGAKSDWLLLGVGLQAGKAP